MVQAVWTADQSLLLDGRIIADQHLPARIPIEGRDDVVFVRGAEIADWFIAADKANDGKPNQGKF